MTAGFETTNDLFPGPDIDKTLEHLLALPRIKINMPDAPFPFYFRSLEIPEYQDSFVKHLPTTTALASGLWVSEMTDNADQELWLRVDESIFYGHIDADQPLPQLGAYFRENRVTNIETHGLICYPAPPNNRTYEKGISVRQIAGGLFEVGAISIDFSVIELPVEA